jgi:ornithine cyclodeaminase
VDLPVLAAQLRRALVLYQEDGQAQRVRSQPSRLVTSMVLAPGTAPGVPAYTVKVHAKNPRRRPALTGVMCLHDSESGDLMALLDSGWLTSVRTGVGAALGTDELARRDARTFGVIGAGEQGRAQLAALRALRASSSVCIFDLDPAAAASLADELQESGVDACTATTVQDVAAACDVLLLATWSRTPVLVLRDVKPGTHITSLGADEPGKVELDPQLLAAACVVTDDADLAAPVLPHVTTTLSRVLRKEHPGREKREQVTVYSPLGLPLQDCVVAWHAYERARDLGLGTRVSLEV